MTFQPWHNKENNVFKDALGVKGLGFKHYGNHHGNYHDNHSNHHDNHSNHHGNYHAEQLLFSCQCSKVSSCRVVMLSSLIPWDSGHAEQLFLCLCSNLTVYRRKWQWFFYTLSCEFRVHREFPGNYWYCTSVCICVIMSLWGSRIIIQGDS